jgi:hypothetical protein
LDELEALERYTSLDRDSGSSWAESGKTVTDLTFLGPVVSDDDRKFCGLSQRNHTPDAPPIWTPSSSHSSLQDCSVNNTSMSLASRDQVSQPPSSRIVDLPFPRVTLSRFSLSPSCFHKTLERQLASSESGNDHSDAEVCSAAPNPLLDGLPSRAQNGEFHSTGNCRSNLTWN